jgi:hypothetical protein
MSFGSSRYRSEVGNDDDLLPCGQFCQTFADLLRYGPTNACVHFVKNGYQAVSDRFE